MAAILTAASGNDVTQLDALLDATPPVRQYRRLRVRYERRADIHEDFFRRARALIYWKQLKHFSC